MNQNNNINEKNSSQISQEELMKTQVLNLQDVEEAARYEKATSKKPAILVAVIGFFAIFLGTSLPFVNSLMNQKDTSLKTDKTIEKKQILNTESNLNCTYTSLNNPDGTDTVLNIKLTFNNNKLIRTEKIFSINATIGNPLGITSIQNYINAYQPFLQQSIAGYQMTSTPVENGLIITSNVDLKTFNPETFPELHKSNVATNVDYILNTEKKLVNNDLATKGFTCQ